MSLLILALFVVAGLACAKMAPFAKFALWSLVVTALYAAFLAVASHAIWRALGQAALGFVCLQLSYVAGAALVAASDRRPRADAGAESGQSGADARVKFGDPQAGQ